MIFRMLCPLNMKSSSNTLLETHGVLCFELQVREQQDFIRLAGFLVFAALKIQVEVFWVMTPYNVAVGYHSFGGPCCLHLQAKVYFTLLSYRGVTTLGAST